MGAFVFFYHCMGVKQAHLLSRLLSRPLSSYHFVSLSLLPLLLVPTPCSANTYCSFSITLDSAGLPCMAHLIALVIVLAKSRRQDDYQRAPAHVPRETSPVDPQPQPPQLGGDAEEADLNIGGDPGVPLVPHPRPGAVADVEDFNVERRPDLPFTPSPQPEAVDGEQRHAVEGSPNTPLARTDSRSDVGFPDVASEVQSTLSDDRSIQTCHPEEFGLDGQSSALI